MKVTVTPIVIGVLGTVLENFGKKTGRTGSQEKLGPSKLQHCQYQLECLELRPEKTPVKNHQLNNFLS